MLQIKIKLIFLFFLGIHGGTAVIHSWKAFYTGSTGLREFPEFVALHFSNDALMGYFDSRTNRFEGKQDWVREYVGQEYMDTMTNILQGQSQRFKGNIGILMERFNHSKGVHIFQEMYGCEWDDETKDIRGFHQFGYDGEDLIALDLKTATWIASKPQGVMTKHKWERERAFTDFWINYHAEVCPGWLKKYENYGRISLLRTELPSVSVLQKTPSSVVRCHATGFYPDRAEMFWRKDGEEIHEGVGKGEILPNNDGTFQMNVDLKLSSETPEDRTKYECVFQLSGVKEDMITKLKDDGFPTVAVIGGVLAFGLLVLVGVVGFLCWRRGSKKKGFQKTNTSETPSSPSIDPDAKKEAMKRRQRSKSVVERTNKKP